MQRSGLFSSSVPSSANIQKKRWNPFRIIWTALKRTCMVVGALVLFMAALGAVSAVQMMKQVELTLPDEMILVLKIDEQILELEHGSKFPVTLPTRRHTAQGIIETLDRASKDARVKGLLVSIKNGGVSLAHIEEIRAAVKRFRASGKFAYIYSPSFGELGQGLGVYYFASAFEQIWMQPVGFLSMAGVNAEMPFIRDVLDKWGIQPQVLQREEYKTAYENATHSHMSPENRDMLKSMTTDIVNTMLKEIAADRGIPQDVLMHHVDTGLLTGEEALTAKLIDRLDYADILTDEARVKAGGNAQEETPELVTLSHYAGEKVKVPPPGPRKDIALVHVSGMIMDMQGRGENVAGADEIGTAIAIAAKDESIEAIVVRIDSPGGSPTASETIRRTMMLAREEGKKVIVSMGPTAASGGYWIAVAGERIFALPTTMTGSIGVIMGKADMSAMWDKLGVNWESVRVGENAGIFSFNHPFTESEYARMNTLIDDVYDGFLMRVAEGRKLPPEKVREMARGRVWTGHQAKALGLVDDLGGLDTALDYTAQQIGLTDRTQLKIRVMPEPKSPVEQLLDLLGGQVKAASWIAGHGEFFDTLSPILNTLKGDTVSAYDPAVDMMR